MGTPEKIVFYGTGRRKTASAAVYLKPAGSGCFMVNHRPMGEYFTSHLAAQACRPLQVLGIPLNQLDLDIRVRGGGVSAQAGAVQHGLARALCEYDPSLKVEEICFDCIEQLVCPPVVEASEDISQDEVDQDNIVTFQIGKGMLKHVSKKEIFARKILKIAGLLKRDARKVQRKKPGFRKARKSEQYRKR